MPSVEKKLFEARFGLRVKVAALIRPFENMPAEFLHLLLSEFPVQDIKNFPKFQVTVANLSSDALT